jgi:hypothetical protein
MLLDCLACRCRSKTQWKWAPPYDDHCLGIDDPLTKGAHSVGPSIDILHFPLNVVGLGRQFFYHKIAQFRLFTLEIPSRFTRV